ncbi:transglycosylase SLT domain-containing protein [Solidesulfovibrio sp.]
MEVPSFDAFVGMMTGVRDELGALRAAAPVTASVPIPCQDEVIVAMAGSYQLPVVIVQAMVAHESAGGIPCAVRFEPDFYEQYLKGKTPNFRPHPSCSWETERIQRATSWGLMQVMGETARCVGFRGWFPELCQPAVGLEWGCRYLRRLADKYLTDGDWPTVMRAYNGGPGNRNKLDSPYPSKILEHIPGGVWPQ